MYVVGVKMCCNNNLLILAPHTPCCFKSYFMSFFRCNFARLETLIAVICHISSRFPEMAFCYHHLLISSHCQAVDTAYKHFHICFIIVFCVFEYSSQVIIKILWISGLVGIVCIFYNIPLCAFNRPESRCSHHSSSSFRSVDNSFN